MRRRINLWHWLLPAMLLLSGCDQQAASQIVVSPNAVIASPQPTAALPTDLPEPTASSQPVPLPTQTTPPLPTLTPLTGLGMPHLSAGTLLTLTALNMLDAQAGWASGGLAGESEHILRTSDGGKTWQDVTPPQEPPAKGGHLAAISHFYDAQTAWTFYTLDDGTPLQPAVVWRTADGGLSWQPSQQLDLRGLEWTFAVSDVQFTDLFSGWLLAHVGVGMNHDYVMLFHTADGGETWQRLIDPYIDGGIQACYKPGMVFSDAQDGWLPVDCNGVAPGAMLYHTRDGGLTWETVDLPSPPEQPALFENFAAACGVRSVHFFTPLLGRAGVTCAIYETEPLTYQYYLYSTLDGGLTWTTTPYPGGELVFLTPQLGWAQNEAIYRTTDGGLTWTKISSVSWQAEFDFVSDSLGWALAQADDQFALVRSEDGGVYWSEIKPVIYP